MKTQGNQRIGMNDRGLYLYGVIRSDVAESLGAIDIGHKGVEVFSIPFQGLAAIVSETSQSTFEPTKENLLGHQAVISRIMETSTIVPMSFGNVFRSTEDVLNLLKEAYQEFKSALTRIENKVELGLKVLWMKAAFAEEIQRIGETHKDIKRIKAKLAGDQEVLRQSYYQEAIQLGQMIEQCINRRNAEFANEICSLLNPLAEDTKINNLIGERLVLNAAFLVRKERMPEFDAKVEEIARGYGDLFTFNYTGPWPPYNFVDIKIRMH